jgi:8-oxo-dGTP diphosphatase
VHRPHHDTRLAAYAVVVDDRDRLLLARWHEGPEPLWTMPGGGVELEETPAQAVVREVREETGYDVELVRLLGLDTLVQPGADRRPPQAPALKSLRIVYAARVVGGTLRHEVDGSTDEARWVPLAEVPGLRRVSLVDASLALWRGAGGGPAEDS